MNNEFSETITEEDDEILRRARRAAIERYGEELVLASEEAFDAACIAFEASESRDVA